MPLWIEYRSFSSIQMNILFRVINSATVGAAAAVAAIVHPLQARSKKFYIFQAAFNQCGLLLCGFFLHFVLLESGVEIIEPYVPVVKCCINVYMMSTFLSLALSLSFPPTRKDVLTSLPNIWKWFKICHRHRRRRQYRREKISIVWFKQFREKMI